MESERYGDAFYKAQKDGSRVSASLVAPCVLSLFPHVRDVVDFGCGAGGWLKEFELAGKNIQGYDFGAGVPENLFIPPEKFTPADLSAPIETGGKFDLAISLEVAEHIPAASAATFIGSLTNAADIVLFSAAAPGQGGKGHHNEQWPDYWAALFAGKGFCCFDILRPRFWNEARIRPWYRQNMMLYLRDSVVEQHRHIAAHHSFGQLPVVHPEVFSHYLNMLGNHKKVIDSYQKRLYGDKKDL